MNVRDTVQNLISIAALLLGAKLFLTAAFDTATRRRRIDPEDLREVIRPKRLDRIEQIVSFSPGAVGLLIGIVMLLLLIRHGDQ